jgi:hypothetical protein
MLDIGPFTVSSHKFVPLVKLNRLFYHGPKCSEDFLRPPLPRRSFATMLNQNEKGRAWKRLCHCFHLHSTKDDLRLNWSLFAGQPCLRQLC